MNPSLLWYDNNPTRDLADRVRAACACYARKFSEAANVCYVHESAIETSALTTVVDGVRVVTRKWALLHHFQAGREEKDSGR